MAQVSTVVLRALGEAAITGPLHNCTLFPVRASRLPIHALFPSTGHVKVKVKAPYHMQVNQNIQIQKQYQPALVNLLSPLKPTDPPPHVSLEPRPTRSPRARSP